MKKLPFTLIIILLGTILGLTSCEFNSKFYYPKKISLPFSTPVISKENGDTLYTLNVLSDSVPPVFTNKNGEEIEFDYHIESALIKSASGNTIHGWFIEPADSVKNNITLFFLHGNGGNILSYLSLVFPFVEQGYQAFMFDYSGYGLSDGKPNRKNVYNDANSAFNHLRSRDEVKGNKIVVYGQSLGGHLTPSVALQNIEFISGIVIEGAFSSHKDIAAQGAGIFGRIFVRETYPAKKLISKLRLPTLIIHSTDDSVIPFKMGEKLYQNANEPKELFVIDGCHICGPKFYAEEISEKIQSMLNK